MVGKEASHLESVARMSLHAKLQGLESLEEQERIERAQRRTIVTQAFHARFHDVGEIAKGLIEADAMVALARLEQLRECSAIPWKSAAVDDHAADGSPVATDELGGRVQDDVGAVLDGPAKIGRGEGVVDHEGKICLVGDRRNSFDVQNAQQRIADGFAIDDAGTRCDGTAEVFWVVRIDEGGVDTETPEADVKLRVRAPVEIFRGDDLVAGPEQVGNSDELRGLTARYRQRSHASLERRHALLEHRRCRVHNARINVAEALEIKEIGGVLGVFEDVGCRLVNRHGARAGFGVRTMPGMQSARVEPEDVIRRGTVRRSRVYGAGKRLFGHTS